MGFLAVPQDALDAADVVGAQVKIVVLTGSIVLEFKVREEIKRLKRGPPDMTPSNSRVQEASRSNNFDETGEKPLKAAIAGEGFEDKKDDVLVLLDNFEVVGDESLGELRSLNSVCFGILLQVTVGTSV